MTGISKDDRRRDIRILVHAALDFTYREFSSDKVFSAEGYVQSLSQGGISFRTKKSLPNVSFIEIEIQIPFINKTIKPTVQILWRQNEKGQYGGKFTSITDEESAALDQYINYPSVTKKILMDRRMRNDETKIPSKNERRKKT